LSRERALEEFLLSSTFASLGAPADIVSRLTARGITQPFPIQAATLPDALRGRDICGRAPTGSGKTIAFGIPLVARVTAGSARRPHGLVLVPTRELAAQVTRELRMIAGAAGRSVMPVYGGVAFGPQIDRLRLGVDIIVACPGRLGDLVRKNHVALDAVEAVVIDEADRMADMGFLPEVRRLLDQVRPERQTLLFSATLDGAVDVLVRRYQRDPARHELRTDDIAQSNRHVFWKTEGGDRVGLLADVLRTQTPAIVFCRTRHGADRLTKQLVRLGVAAIAIHGDRSQSQRSRALAMFADGKIDALVATDVAARGIHVDEVALVVHYDPPASHKDYIHRSGRTGRAGRAGIVISFVDRKQHQDSMALQRQLGLNTKVEHADLDRLDSGRGRDKRATAARRKATVKKHQPARRTSRDRSAKAVNSANR
jgi:superfamily II DNA/RNA helicase